MSVRMPIPIPNTSAFVKANYGQPRDLTEEDYEVWAHFLWRISYKENRIMQWSMWSDYRDYELMRWALGVRVNEDYGLEHSTMPLTCPTGAVAGDVLWMDRPRFGPAIVVRI